MKRHPAPMKLATLAIHGGSEAPVVGAPVVRPLVQTVNFIQEFGTDEGLRYPRYGNSPNAEVLQNRIALLEGADAGLMLSSGMGATACALLALLRPGDHLLASSWLYGGTRRLLSEEFAMMGIDVTLVDPLESRGWRKRLRKTTRAIFVETPVNPTCRVLDLAPLSFLTKEAGLALVVDSTFASPVNLRPLDIRSAVEDRIAHALDRVAPHHAWRAWADHDAADAAHGQATVAARARLREPLAAMRA